MRTMLSLLARWRINLESQMLFLGNYLGNTAGGWRSLEYEQIAPIIRNFDLPQRKQLHTPDWQRIFTLVCDDKSIVDAAQDLGLPKSLEGRWIEEERSWNPF
jgi:hypothetical protein